MSHYFDELSINAGWGRQIFLLLRKFYGKNSKHYKLEELYKTNWDPWHMDGLVTLVLGALLEKNRVVPLSVSSNGRWVGYIYS